MKISEVDAIADMGDGLMPIEIKAGQTINRDFFTSLERWMAFAGNKAAKPFLIYGGAERHVRREVRVFGHHDSASTVSCL